MTEQQNPTHWVRNPETGGWYDPTTPTLREKWERELAEKLGSALAEYVRTALEWPATSRGPWDTEDAARIAELEDELAKARTVAAGRGVAEAMALLLGGEADSYIRDQVQKAQAQKTGDGAAPAEQQPAPAEQQPEPAPAAGGFTEEEVAKLRSMAGQGFDAETLAQIMDRPVEQVQAALA